MISALRNILQKSHRFNLYFLFFYGLSLLIFACSDENNVRHAQLKPIHTFTLPAEISNQPWVPGDFLVTSRDELIFSDIAFHRLLTFDNSGNLKKITGSAGREPGTFITPIDLGQFSDTLAVWDAQNRRVQLFDLNGVFSRIMIPEPNIGFNSKTFDPGGNLYYATGGFRADSLIYAYNSIGEFFKTMGGLEAPRQDVRDLIGMRMEFKNKRWPAFYKNNVLLCAPTQETLFIAHNYLPLVKGFKTDGTLLFKKALKIPYLEQLRESVLNADSTLAGSLESIPAFWKDISADPTGGVYLLLNFDNLVIYHFNKAGELIEKLEAPTGKIDFIHVSHDVLWTVSNETPLRVTSYSLSQFLEIESSLCSFTAP